MRIFTDAEQISVESRPFLADILRPYFNNRTLQQNLAIYGPKMTLHQVVESLTQADLGVLPLSWNYYLQRGRITQAQRFVERVQRAGIPAVIWVSGDFSLHPPIENAWLFMAGGYQSTRKTRQYAFPVMIRDPLPRLELSQIIVQDKSSLPTVGFCGQADGTFFDLAGKCLRLIKHNLKSTLGLSPFEKQPLLPPTWLRKQALDLLQRAPGLQTNFIRRRQYKAGAQTKQQIETAHRDFFKNILESDYTLCLRGSGNFSARLYETLAMGRIPLFINTDCILPFDRWTDWQSIMVWNEERALGQLPQNLQTFHQNLSPSDFRDLQNQARGFWQEKLSFNGFLGQFERHFE